MIDRPYSGMVDTTCDGNDCDNAAALFAKTFYKGNVRLTNWCWGCFDRIIEKQKEKFGDIVVSELEQLA